MTPEKVEQVLSRALARQELRGTVKWSPSKSETVTIANNPVTLKVADGMDDSGHMMISLRGVFVSKQGDVALFIIGPTSNWTQSNIDRFLGTLQ